MIFIFLPVSLLLSLSLFGSIVAQSLSPAERAAKRLPLSVCQADWGDEQILCGTFPVFENRQLGTGRIIQIKVLVIPALSENPEPEPLVFLHGGPGVPATSTASYFATESPFRKTRDILLIDQRGTGESNPLHCNLIGDSSKLQNYLNEMYPPHLVSACRQELEKIADLTQYTTAISMADLDDVRNWLGYERLNIFGLSYGGRSAYVYARAYPNRVRAIALLGPADIASRMPLFHAQEAEKAFRLLSESCEADSLCNRAFPNVRQELKIVVQRLREHNTTATYVHPGTGDTVLFSIRADVFVEALRAGSYEPGSASELPWIIHQSFLGNFKPFFDIVIPTTFDEAPFLAEGLYLSITGAEDAPFITDAEATRLAEGTLLGDYRVAQQQRASSLWPRGVLPEGYFDSVLLSVPTLIIQGGRDPVIGEGTAIRRYANGREIVIPQMGHLPWGLSNPECIDNLFFSFIESADHRNLDTACIHTMLSPPFKIEEVAAEKK